MSLVIGLAYKDQYVIVSNDSKVTIQWYDAETLEPTDEIEIQDTDLTHEKVFPLTNKVLLSTTGYMYLGDLVKKEMDKRVRPENDLTECAEILKSLILELKAGELTDLSEDEKSYLRFLDTDICINLFGFNHSGTTGFADFNPVEFTVNTIESPLDKKGYPVIIQSSDPVEDRKNMYPYLTLPSEQQTFNNFENSFLIVHAYLSSIHKNVSTDCNFHVLFNNGESINYYKKTVETLDFYELLGLVKPV
jgi:hypothetical protein